MARERMYNLPASSYLPWGMAKTSARNMIKTRRVREQAQDLAALSPLSVHRGVVTEKINRIMSGTVLHIGGEGP